MKLALEIIGFLIAYAAFILFLARCMAFGMGTLEPTPSQAGRALGKIPDAELKRRRDAKTAQLRAELGR